MYQKDIFRYLISLTHSQGVAEDLTSEVFISAIKALPNFRGDSDIKTWLFSIARHKWYEYVRKEKKDQSAVEKLIFYIEQKDVSIEADILNKETYARIISLIESERERSQTIFNLRMEGYSFCEIAGKVGISESAARVIDFRLRKKMREILTKEGYFNA